MVILLLAFTPLSCKKKAEEPPLKEMNSNESYVSVIKSFNYISKNTASLNKSSGVATIATDSVPIILDLLLNYNETENSGNLENMEILEFQYDICSNTENRSNISHLDSLYDLMAAKIEYILEQSTETNEVLFFVNVQFDGRQNGNLKGITLLMKRGWGNLQLNPKTVPTNLSFRAHRGIEQVFGLKTYYGGQCGQFTSFSPGAPDILQNYGNFNLNLVSPAAPNGYRYIYAGNRGMPLYPNNTYDPNHPTFSMSNYLSNAPLTFYPTKVYACASSSSWVTGRNTQDPDPANHFNTLTAPCISSSLMNYYLNSIQSLAIQYQQPFERAVIIRVGDERARISTCSPWASNPNPNFNTGTSIDNGVCPQGQHFIGITYKNLVLVPIGM
jgi:hypothetical protein